MSEHSLYHNRTMRFMSILGVSLFCSFLTLSLAYMVGFINTIGFKTELIPIISGVIPGIVLFMFLGILSKRKYYFFNIVAGIFALTVISLISNFILRIEDYTLTYALFAVIPFMLSFSAYPIAIIFSHSDDLNFGLREKSFFAMSAATLTVVIIFIEAAAYELLGQHTLPQELDLNGILSFFTFLVLLYLSWNHDGIKTEA